MHRPGRRDESMHKLVMKLMEHTEYKKLELDPVRPRKPAFLWSEPGCSAQPWHTDFGMDGFFGKLSVLVSLCEGGVFEYAVPREGGIDYKKIELGAGDAVVFTTYSSVRT